MTDDLLAEAEGMLGDLEGITFDPTKAGVTYAVELLDAIKSEERDALRQRDRAMRPVAIEMRKVNAAYAGVLDLYKRAKAIVRMALIVSRSKYQRAIKEVRDGMAAAIAADDHESARYWLDRLEAVSPGDKSLHETLPDRQFWDFEITNKDQIPSEFLVVDQPLLRNAVQTHKAETDIPGIRVFRRKGSS